MLSATSIDGAPGKLSSRNREIKQAMIEARGISKTFLQARFKRSVAVLENIFLSVRQREFLSIVGPSGCGKTTLLHILAGLLSPSDGCVLINGKPVVPGRDSAIVFQNPALLPWRAVTNNISYGLECLKADSRQARSKAESLLELVGLVGFGHHYPHELSRGMQQRVSLARALAVDPEFLLMDEPFASLDPQTRDAMQRELLTIWERSQNTIIFVTHQVSEAVFLSDRVVVLSGSPGRVRSIVDVHLPRPRNPSVKYSEAFKEYEHHVQAFLGGDHRTAGSRSER